MVDSYARLLPDKQDEIILLLRTIATQNYTTNNGLTNITASVPIADVEVEVPAWVLQVNKLWFSSLTLSLATASIGMLVKSWLREYLAIHTAAPRERLRAHYRRAPAMQRWFVYGIIAFLPIMLQISLALFFAGLCILTAAVDRDMGLTNVSLIAAWAFFLCITTVAPVFFPRCPYNVYALQWLPRESRKAAKRIAMVSCPSHEPLFV